MTLRRRRHEVRHEIVLDQPLRESMLHLGARHPNLFGHALARLRDARGLTADQQAEDLGLSPSRLAYLAMSPRPRPDRRDADLAEVAGRIGICVEELERLLADARVGDEVVLSEDDLRALESAEARRERDAGKGPGNGSLSPTAP